MTLQELYDSVAQLGFETSLEDDDRFYLATNRAIKQVGRIRPATSVYELNHIPIENFVSIDTDKYIECPFEYECFGVKAYYFEANGNGVAIIEKKNSDGNYSKLKEISLESKNRAFVAYKGFIRDGVNPYIGNIRIRFMGEYLYYVKNFALYPKILSNSEVDIPSFGRYVKYDISKLVADFVSFTYPPIVDATRDESFVLGKDYFVEGRTSILLDRNKSGTYEVCYYRQRKSIKMTEDALSEEIDLDAELSALLPLLVAAYVWADDEPAKAEYYLTLYREQENYMRSTDRYMASVKYRNKSGW